MQENYKVVEAAELENYRVVEVVEQENYKVVEVVEQENYKAVEENCRVVERGSCKVVEED